MRHLLRHPCASIDPGDVAELAGAVADHLPVAPADEATADVLVVLRALRAIAASRPLSARDIEWAVAELADRRRPPDGA